MMWVVQITVGYPIRGIRKKGASIFGNFETDRWPGGNPETGYLNCDGSPIKSLLIDQRRKGETNIQANELW